MTTQPLSPIRWMWIFLDTPAADAPRSWEFWRQVTGTTLSETRGDSGEFATLLAPTGGSWIKLQAINAGPGGVHLDLDVDDVSAQAERAEALGARRVGAIGETVVIMTSPGGFTFCLTTAGEQAAPVREGLTSVLDQVCLDIPVEAWDAEVAFWTALTGWPYDESVVPEFAFLLRPADIPVRVLFQRLGEQNGPVRGHVDFACLDRDAVMQEHVAAGASVIAPYEHWTVMADPTGRRYCVTERNPVPPPGR